MRKHRKNPPIDQGILDSIGLCIDQIGPKKTLKIIEAICRRNTIEKCIFPSVLLATQKDEEMAEAFFALHYLGNSWKATVNKGTKLIRSKVKKLNGRSTN